MAQNTNQDPIANPVVSVILPIYNVEKYLEQCLDSVCDQTLQKIEIICIDDGATDRSAQIIDRFAEKDSRIVPVHKQNEGYGKGVNTGLSIARGQYVGIVEPDDYIDHRMFEKLFETAKSFDFPDIVKSSYWRVCDAGTTEETIAPCYYQGKVECVNTRFTIDQDASLLYYHPSIWTAIYKREWLNSNDIKMKEIPGAGWADNPWLMETMLAATGIVYIDEPLYYYREFRTGSSSNLKDPSIIYNRWFDMDEILKQRHITEPRVLEAHYSRGCAYIDMLENDFDKNDPEIAAALKKMLDLMDGKAIMKSDKILRDWKYVYRKHAPLNEKLLYWLHR